MIANELTRELLARGEQARLVSRRARPHPGAEVFAADLAHAHGTLAAVQGAKVVYLVAGLPYWASAWTHLWPWVMRNTLEACKRTGARRVCSSEAWADRIDPSPGRIKALLPHAKPAKGAREERMKRWGEALRPRRP